MALIAIFMCVSFISCTDEYDDSVLNNKIDDLEYRVIQLEELCKQMNTNISALQILIEAMQNQDCITNITPINKEGKDIGYTISFTHSQPITVYHGKDGENGTNGSNGNTPIIGVKQDTDGIYYWTINNEWLIDPDGKKVKAQGINGSNGNDGINGTNGITPKLKIENNYWHVSYDNGKTWEKLDKATGENGANGSNGNTPIISSKQDNDGIFYWTVNNEWLIDSNGNKIKAQGTDGVNGITPKFKIEDNYWHVSYDNGKTWIKLDKATGENGIDGKDGDSMFKDITIMHDKVTFILNNKASFTIPLYSSSYMTIEVSEAGTLNKILTAEQKRDLISLSIKGKLNQQDIRTILYKLENIQVLDLSNAHYVDHSFYFHREDKINGHLTELVLPKLFNATGMSISLDHCLFLEKITISSDTTIFSTYVDNLSYYNSFIDSLIVNEGIKLAINEECFMNIPNVVLPSTMQEVNIRSFGWDCDRQLIKLSTVICKSIVPPSIGKWTTTTEKGYHFENYSISPFYSGEDWRYASECTLIVPKESIELYKQDKYWKHFGKILPLNQ